MAGPLHAPPLLLLYPFRFRDPVSGKWVRARYVAGHHEIAARYAAASHVTTRNDPRPVAPVRPSREDCCKGSCDPCIFDVYDDALDRYRRALKGGQKNKTRRKR